MLKKIKTVRKPARGSAKRWPRWLQSRAESPQTVSKKRLGMDDGRMMEDGWMMDGWTDGRMMEDDDVWMEDGRDGCMDDGWMDDG